MPRLALSWILYHSMGMGHGVVKPKPKPDPAPDLQLNDGSEIGYPV